MMLYTCIIPCYNSEKSIAEVVKLLEDYFQDNNFGDLEIILVNDYSKDCTIKAIREIVDQYSNVIGIDLAKNTGQHNALLAGAAYANGDFIISLDDDLQTHPSQIGKLINKIDEGYDIVYGSYKTMNQSKFRNLGRAFNDYTVRKLIGKPKGLEASSFWIIRKFVKDEIIKSESNFTNIQGLFLRTSNKITNVEIEHFSRVYGSSNYTMKKLIRLWASCLNYSYIPFRLCLGLGASSFMLSIIFYVVIALITLFGQSFDIKFSLLLNSMLFFTSLIIFFMGMIGEYIGRIFMTVTKDPQYIVKEVVKKD